MTRLYPLSADLGRLPFHADAVQDFSLVVVAVGEAELTLDPHRVFGAVGDHVRAAVAGGEVATRPVHHALVVDRAIAASNPLHYHVVAVLQLGAEGVRGAAAAEHPGRRAE